MRNKNVLITGADGGIGTAFIHELITRNIGKIYAACLSENTMGDICKKYQNVIPIKLDVTAKKDIESCALKYKDVDILINNAGVECNTSFLSENTEKADFEMAVNYLGLRSLTNRYMETLSAREDSSIVNILSIASFLMIQGIETYCASKTAAHLYTQDIRRHLEGKVSVYAVYPGYVDTSMVANIDIDKISPQALVKNICDEIGFGVLDIYPDRISKSYQNKNRIMEYFYKG